jgi:hypothetical protein
VTKSPNIFELIEKREFETFVEVVDKAFKEAAREASKRAHAMGLEVADGRAAEDRRRKPIKSVG